MEGAAAYLFDIFKFSPYVGSQETTKIRNIFGPFPASVATKACEVVQKIVSWLPEDVLSESDEPGRQEADGAAIIQEFGKYLKFSFPKSNNINEVLSSSESEEEKQELNFDLKYNGSSHSQCVPSKVEKRIDGAETKRFDYAWLLSEVKQYFPHEETSLGMTVNDLATSLFDVLCSIKSDEELQNEVITTGNGVCFFLCLLFDISAFCLLNGSKGLTVYIFLWRLGET